MLHNPKMETGLKTGQKHGSLRKVRLQKRSKNNLLFLVPPKLCIAASV